MDGKAEKPVEGFNAMRDLLLLIGRILLVVIFVYSGLTKFYALGDTAAYIAAKGLPLASILSPLSAVAELGLGLAVLIGFRTRLAALGLVLFCLVTILFFHDFWNMTGQDRATNQIEALKNLSLIGAFVMLAGVGAGRYSADRA